MFSNPGVEGGTRKQDGVEDGDGDGLAAVGRVDSGTTTTTTTTTTTKEDPPTGPSRSSELLKAKNESRRRSESSRRPSIFLSGNRRSLSQDSLLQSSALHTSGLKAPAPIEAAVWDWERPSSLSNPNPAEPSSYFYEPQGELLKERTRRAPEGGFSIPDPVGAAVNPLEALLAAGGVKRKATLDFEAKESSGAHKRPAINMGEDSGRQRGAGEGRTLAPTTDSSSSSSTTHLPLPARKVFPIQIGDKLFRLSGASISSDAPSYFSQFFEEQMRRDEGADSVRTLYIDRDPATFEDISLHLQGYHVEPRDGSHFVRLFADAQFFSLPRLTAQLFASPIYVTIGDTPFRIPRDLFSATPGNSPNYFTLGFQIFFTKPTDAFPGLNQRNLLRPPSLLPPSVPHRSAEIFADLLSVLKGYEVRIRDDEHRTSLIRDARYFHFKGVEQRLVKCRVGWNLRRGWEEIEIGLGDLRQSGLAFVADGEDDEEGEGEDEDGEAVSAAFSGMVYYSRPYVDREAYVLVVEIGGEESVELRLRGRNWNGDGWVGRVRFWRQTLARMGSLIGVVVGKMDLQCDVETLGIGENGDMQVVIGRGADVVVDGKEWRGGQLKQIEDGQREEVAVRGREECSEWVVKSSQWRVKARAAKGSAGPGVKFFLEAVKIEAFSSERARKSSQGFL